MRIKDLYCTVLSIVCRVTDLEENEIFCSNKEECVDARSLLIKTLIDNGITEKEIVRLTGLSQQRVNSLKIILNIVLVNGALQMIYKE